MRKRVFLAEVEKLHYKGIIDDETTKKIKEYYEYERVNIKNFSVYLTVIGLVMISLGIILLFAYNWSLLTRTVKTTMIGMLLTGSQGLLGYAIYRNKKWINGAGIFVMAMCGASIALISQMYNISGSDTGFFLAWGILCLPVVYLSESLMTGCLYTLILLLYIKSGGDILIYTPLFLAQFLFEVRGERFSRLTEVLTKVLGLIGFVYWYEGLGGGGGYFILFYGGLLALLYTLNLGLRGVGEMGLLVLGYILTFSNGYLGKVDTLGIKGATGIAVFTAAAGLMIYRKKVKDPMFLLLVLMPFSLIFSWIHGVFTGILLALGIYYIYRGVKTGEGAYFNRGAVLTGLILITRFLDYDISTLLRGLVFIGVGAGLICGNIYISRRKG